jgi:hypothetical protein
MNNASNLTIIMVVALVAVILWQAVPAYGVEPVFPPNSFVEGWKAKGQTREFTRNGLYGHIDGGSELFLEFGFEVLHVRKYQDPSGTEEISLETYRMESPEAALAIYLMKCGTETLVPGIDNQVRHTGDRYQFTLLKGSYFITVNNFNGNASVMPAMIRMANLVLENIPPVKPVDLFHFLPGEDRVPGSEMLFRGPYSLQAIYTLGEGDVLLLGNKVFGVTAQYLHKKKHANPGVNPETFNRLVIPYPDESSGQKAYAHLKANLDTYIKVISIGENELTFEDYRGKFGRISIKKEIISIEVNLPGIE